MKRKLLIVLLAVISAVCLALCLAACSNSGKKENYNGTYYLFVDEEYVKSEYITLDGNNWSDSNNMSGTYEIKDGSIYLYVDIFGQQTVWQEGKVQNGGLTFQGFSGEMTYYREGTAHIHSFSNWQTVKEATCTAAGEKMRACSCGLSEKQTIPALGHDINETYIPSTCQNKGSKSGTCERCKEQFYEEVPVNPDNHYIEEGKPNTICSGCGTELAESLNFNGDGTLTGGSGVTIIIPAIYHGKPVTSIGNYAFRYCTSLTSITIPDSVTSIGYQAFYNCTSLTGVYITDLKAWCNIEFWESDGNPLSYAYNFYLNNELITNITAEMLQGVTEIKAYAFYNCTSLENITIPASVTSIGRNAFNGCTKLIQTEGGVKYVDKWVVGYDTSITKANLRADTKGIANYVFEGYKSLKNITIPDSVTSIGSSVFNNCTNLASVNFGNNSKLESIGDNAFYGCTSLKSITIPNSVTSIGRDAFSDCNSLTGVYITDLKAWCNIEFGGSYGTPLNYAHNLYLNGKPVTEITADMLQGITEIKDYAFYECTRLESITIPDSVTSIGDYAFWYCTRLESITIPDSVTSIGDYAFRDCYSLISITIPDSVTSIGYRAFNGCINLIQTEGGVKYVDKWVVRCDTSVTNVNLRADTKGIADAAFEYCKNLKSITIPDSVTSIGYEAFNWCDSLTNITIPDSVTSIGKRAFYLCTSLESITIPASVTSIGDEAFDRCNNLATVYYGGNKTQWNSISIGYYNSKLENATRYYFSETAPDEDKWSQSSNWWHYDPATGEIAIWEKQ